ncbi:MAG: transcriptional regulator protein [Devosia sp.]|uniref:MarR family winged helix-turn-helix transcriptional regulator n=1 Tax=Devosia sp. TaxID=1871048 RepID=UPI0026067AAC|nr:MarR family transcriptional regulator [Devosia sp.]MDB5529549.1 transcriptional regulator protein [Devosia sp.]
MREWPLYERPGHLINRAARVMMRLAEGRFRPMGLGVASFPVLTMLRRGEKLSQKELTARVRIEQSSMAQLLARLERDGMIERTPDPNDGRSTLISLSAKAMALLPQIDLAVNVGNEEATAGMSDAEIDLLVHLLQRLIGNLESVREKEEASAEV